MAAEAMNLDFSNIDPDSLPPSAKFKSGKPKKLTPKQIRARARRKAARLEKGMSAELELLHKPIEEWDAEELARGRPRAADGTFKGRTPDWIPRAMHEAAVERFKDLIRGDLSSHTLLAVKTVKDILENDDEDEKGRPVVPAATKLEASKFLIEHLLGKPKQEVKQDISIKLQGILASATVMQEEQPIDVESWEDPYEDA